MARGGLLPGRDHLQAQQALAREVEVRTVPLLAQKRPQNATQSNIGGRNNCKCTTANYLTQVADRKPAQRGRSIGHSSFRVQYRKPAASMVANCKATRRRAIRARVVAYRFPRNQARPRANQQT